MSQIEVVVHIDAPPTVVWAHLADIASHVEWMADAVAIRFDTAQRQGEGTSFVCDTKVGPIRLADHMEITEWSTARSMGVHHVGVVSGTGLFVLHPDGPGATHLTWVEDLSFPWWLGGTPGSWCARPILRRIWKGNLKRLRDRVMSPST